MPEKNHENTKDRRHEKDRFVIKERNVRSSSRALLDESKSHPQLSFFVISDFRAFVIAVSNFGILGNLGNSVQAI
jgi:hypothetical protein